MNSIIAVGIGIIILSDEDLLAENPEKVRKNKKAHHCQINTFSAPFRI